MKKTPTIIIALVMALLMLASAIVPAMAEEFNFDPIIAKFDEKSGNTEELTVGDTHTARTNLWLDEETTQCHISDESVISYADGIITAEGKGTAYYVLIDGSGRYIVTRYVVKDRPLKEKILAGIFGEDTAIFKFFNNFQPVYIMFLIGPMFLASIVALVIFTIITVIKLDKAMQAISKNPCEETVKAAAEAFNNVKGPIRWNICLGGESRGINFPMWRSVFNGPVISARNVSVQAKEELRKGLINVNTYGLRQVYHRQNTRKF